MRRFSLFHLPSLLFGTAFALAVNSEAAWAGSFEGTIQSLVNGFLRILNLLALGYLGRNIFQHIQSEPMAGKETVRVVIGIACLLGINAVWSWIGSQAR